jgi:hypothetical protein
MVWSWSWSGHGVKRYGGDGVVRLAVLSAGVLEDCLLSVAAACVLLC